MLVTLWSEVKCGSERRGDVGWGLNLYESKSVECQTQKFEQFCTEAKNKDGRQKREAIQVFRLCARIQPTQEVTYMASATISEG